MFMNIVCPACGRTCRVPENMMGQVMTCPTCSAVFQCGSVSPPSLAPQLIRPATSAPVQIAPEVRSAQVEPDQQIHYRCPHATSRCNRRSQWLARS